MTLVHDGTKTWIDTPQSGVVEHESQFMRPIGDELLDPATFLPGFEFRIAGDTEVAGRAAIAVEATPRPRGAGPVDLFPYGADALSIAVDRERGVILRFEASAAEQPIRRLEVTEIVFDEPLADELFTVPEGDLRTAHEAYPVNYVTLEQAARDVPFQLWAPARLAGRWNLNVIHRPETTGPRVPESVMLHAPRQRVAARLRDRAGSRAAPRVAHGRGANRHGRRRGDPGHRRRPPARAAARSAPRARRHPHSRLLEQPRRGRAARDRRRPRAGADRAAAAHRGLITRDVSRASPGSGRSHRRAAPSA